MLADSAWPEADLALVTEASIEIGVQVNGKLRDTVSLPRDADDELARDAAWLRPALSDILKAVSRKRSLS